MFSRLVEIDMIFNGMGIYPRHLKMRVGGKRVKALSIDGLCDWPEREQPTPTQFQRRRVYLIGLLDRSQPPANSITLGITNTFSRDKKEIKA